MIYVSTLAFTESGYQQLEQLMEHCEKKNFGIEIFPHWESDDFNETIERVVNQLKRIPTTTHGPYFDTEHSAAEGTEEYETAMKKIDKLLELCRRTDSKTFVYHHNNIEVTPENKDDLIKHSTLNLHKLNEYCGVKGISPILENTGVYTKNNVLFEEDEFIEMVLKEENDVLIDIGHINANGWNLENVIQKLSHKIKYYHLNNNDGKYDLHLRIHDGTIDFEKFLEIYNKYTPEADLVLEYGEEVGHDLEGILQDIDYLKKHTTH